MNSEKTLKPPSGWLALLLFVVTVVATVYGFRLYGGAAGVPLLLISLLILKSLIIVSPNSSKVLLLFGKYKGTIKHNGLFWINPLYSRAHLSLRARNFESEKIKVNDKMGNPIMISVILVWRVSDTFKAKFEVDSYETFIRIQTD